ncbi:hypothetical protein BJX76DRAFT_362605 [Aspergillus varians]
MGKDKVLRAFHNVCRHRAYPVAKKDSGTSTVLGCRYHGWSYNSRGQLIRAPHFDGLLGFEREENGLFEVGVWCADDGDGDGEGVGVGMGMVWVNLAGEREKEGPGLEVLEGFVKRNPGSGIGNGRSRWVGGGGWEGGFNWKVALRTGFLVDALGLEAKSGSFIQSILGYFQQKPESFHLFPNLFLFTIPGSGSWLSLSFLPTSEKTTSMRYDLYSPANMGDEAGHALLAKLEDKLKGMSSTLETEYQSCIGTSSDSSAILSGLDLESSAPQKHILSLMKEHAKLEKAHGAEIFPARREPRMNVRYQHAEQLCRELDCSDTSTQKSLAW